MKDPSPFAPDPAKPSEPIAVKVTEPIEVATVTGGPQAEAKQVERERVSAGQRSINRVWEYTQAAIAISVTLVTLAVCGYMATHGDVSMSAFLLLSNVFFLVVGTYFQRTNHTKSSSGGNDPPDHR